MVPEYARERNRLALARLERLRRRAEESPLNVLEAGTTDIGIIASGAAYTYAREAFPKAWFLKLGMSHPLPYRKVAKLYDSVSRVFVVEELDPFLEDQVRALGLPVVGKEVIPRNGELNQEIVFDALEPVLKRRPPRRKRPVFPPPPVITPAPHGRPTTCRCGRRCCARAARTAPSTPCCAARRSPSWATSAATRSARCRRCCRSRAACAWARASA